MISTQAQSLSLSPGMSTPVAAPASAYVPMRIPPHDIEAEMALIGSIFLTDGFAALQIAEQIGADDFYRPAHTEVFRASLALAQRGVGVDIVTLKDELAGRGTLEQTGGVEYLMRLGELGWTTANIAHYAAIVRRKAALRALIRTAAEAVAAAYDDPEDIEALVAGCSERVLSLAERVAQGGMSGGGVSGAPGIAPLSAAVEESLEHLDERYHSRSQITGIPTGFTDLDYLTGGFQRGDLIVVGARPSMGKTGLIGGILQNLTRTSYRCLFFSAEMEKRRIADRMLCAEARVDSHRFLAGRLSEGEWERIMEAQKRLWSGNVLIDDTPDISVADIRARVRRQMGAQNGGIDGGIDMVVVDYLQLLKSDASNAENRNHEITAMVRGLKSIARQFRIPVVVLSQLSRGLERREDKRPVNSDLLDSGGIEAAADVVLMLYRAAYYERRDALIAAPSPAVDDDGNEVQEVEVICTKQRNGPTDFVKLAFLPKYVRFDNLAVVERYA